MLSQPRPSPPRSATAPSPSAATNATPTAVTAPIQNHISPSLHPANIAGRVAAHAAKFSQSSSLPTSFGQYDSFYSSLRSSKLEHRNRHSESLRRLHQFRGDEDYLRRAAGTRRGGRRARMERRGRGMLPEGEEDESMSYYEGDDIEAERGFREIREEWDGLANDGRDGAVDEKNIERVLFPGPDAGLNSSPPRIISPALSSCNGFDFQEGDMASCHSLDGQIAIDEGNESGSESGNNSTRPSPSLSFEEVPENNSANSEILPSVSNLTNALMDFTLECQARDEPSLEASSKNIVQSTPLAPFKQLENEVSATPHSETTIIAIATPSPLKPTQEESPIAISTEQISKAEETPTVDDSRKMEETFNNYKSNSPIEHINNSLTLQTQMEEHATPEIHEPTPTSKQRSCLKLTPLSHAIIYKKAPIEEKTKPIKTPPPKCTQLHTSPTVLKSPKPSPYATPKRKPRGIKLGSSKRLKQTPSPESSTTTARRNTRYSISSTSSSVPSSSSSRTKPQLYNGKSIERIQNVKRCDDSCCQWNPNLHSHKGACERCWTVASEAERKEFLANGGRHLRISVVKGGCPPSCKLFSGRVAKGKGSDKTDGGSCDAPNLYEEAVRLCRRCFDDLHHVGIR